MPFVGEKGAHRYPQIRRAELISGDEYMRGGLSWRSHAPQPRTPNVSRQAEWKSSNVVSLTSVNQYGLVSRSEMLFPEAYRPIDTKFWQPLSTEERAELVARQAAANARATFDDERYQPIAATSADAQYAEASSRRAVAMRRRRAPRSYDERKRDTELRRKEPLQRKYTGAAEMFYRASTAIVRGGPIDIPMVVSGLPVFGKADATDAPGKLKAKRRTRRGVAPAPPAQLDWGGREPQSGSPTPVLPTFDPQAAPKARISQISNNPWGLSSWSEMLYPEAYKDVSTIYWRGLTAEQREQIMAVQARAMEKVGYEQGVTPLLIEDPRPDDYVTRKGRSDDILDMRNSTSHEGWVIFVIALALIAALGWAGWRALDNGGALPTAHASPSPTAGSVGEGDE